MHKMFQCHTERHPWYRVVPESGLWREGWILPCCLIACPPPHASSACAAECAWVGVTGAPGSIQLDSGQRSHSHPVRSAALAEAECMQGGGGGKSSEQGVTEGCGRYSLWKRVEKAKLQQSRTPMPSEARLVWGEADACRRLLGAIGYGFLFPRRWK